ncbi:membrane protein YdbS with pleckstrin-like domain [Arthrobacter sp. PvP102]|jgi:membrane protein YdbS with pleckstrin-like domain|uniref:PH domain-containing protein n=1 Tax=unclassified Arthrobacter TaxID=235627 RepID=UPI001AE12D49|nr:MULTISPECIES: PH domain-containing protein [unclassified Arthrobacter]MBP1234796.1 membrane protein YdbS with pleckstrin-like domain [Arthrobacter sp. PvP103]MBP1235754.1 membrane protein YdbS with pleckstrin-like domain [Arthrobacter sp. PvP102]
MRKDLLPGEQVITVTRPQPRKLFFPGLLFIVAPALGAFASAWIVKGEPARLVPLITGEWTFWLVAVCAGAVAWILLGYCLPRVLRWHATQYVLTSRRIIARYGMLRRRDIQIPLAHVHHIGVSQSLWQRILRSGNISLDTGQGADAVIPDVPEAVRFRNFVLDAIDDLPPGVVFEADRARQLAGEAQYYRPRETGEQWDSREGGRDER